MSEPWESTLHQSLRHASTDQLIDELDRRWRQHPGGWTGRQSARIRELSEKLNPPPIRGT